MVVAEEKVEGCGGEGLALLGKTGAWRFGGVTNGRWKYG